jgi:hypothetical protein
MRSWGSTPDLDPTIEEGKDFNYNKTNRKLENSEQLTGGKLHMPIRTGRGSLVICLLKKQFGQYTTPQTKLKTANDIKKQWSAIWDCRPRLPPAGGSPPPRYSNIRLNGHLFIKPYFWTDKISKANFLSDVESVNGTNGLGCTLEILTGTTDGYIRVRSEIRTCHLFD